MNGNENQTAATFTADQIASGFEFSDKVAERLTTDVYQLCVLAKIRPPEGTLTRRWLQAGTGEAYYGQWIWDTMFIAELLALLPGQTEVLRDVFGNYWDFQARWNAKRPAYAHNMVACMIEPRNTTTWAEYPAYSQIPILAWGLERVYRRTGDRTLLRECLAPMERFHEWYWRERDVTNVGLVAVGSYSGVVQHARYETFDFECNLDDLQLTPHPVRRGPEEGNWYGDICLPGITGYLLLSELSLSRLADELGDVKMAARRRMRYDAGVAAMRKHMWDDEAGCFLAVRRDSLKKIPVPTIGSWTPLQAGVPTPAMAARMAEVLLTENWMTPLPIPTVGRNDPRWRSDAMWRGDVWPPTNYQVAAGLVRYGFGDLAARIADTTVANAVKVGINERYDSLSGKPVGVPGLGMSCTFVTMMLDGLTRTHRAMLRRQD